MTQSVDIFSYQVYNLSFVIPKRILLINDSVLPTVNFDLLFHAIDFHLNFHFYVKFQGRFALNCSTVNFSRRRVCVWFVRYCI